MTNQEKVCRVMLHELSSREWKPVFSQESGVFLKNGFLFVLYAKTLPNFQSKKSFDNPEVVSDAMIFFRLPAVSWHLEKHGWLYDKGTISSDIASFYDYPDLESSKLTVLKLVDRVESIALADDLDTMHLRERLAPIYSKHIVDALQINTKAKVSETLMFVCRQADDYLKSLGLQEKHFYRVVDVISDAVCLFEINVLGQVVSDSSISLDKKTFSHNIDIKNLLALDFFKKEGKEKELVQIKASTGTACKLPNDLEEFGLEGAQRVALGFAFAENLNYTIFLTNKFKSYLLPIVLKILQSTSNVQSLLFQELSEEKLNVIENFARNGYDTSALIKGSKSDADFKLISDDILGATLELEQKLRKASINSDVIKAIQQISIMSLDIDHLYSAKNPFEVHLLHNLYLEHDVMLSQCMLQFGIALKNMMYMNWSNVPVPARSSLRRMFLTRVELSICGQDWNLYLDKLFKSATYLIFIPQIGFSLRYRNIILSRDANSFVVYNVLLQPIWRAILLNQKFIVNRKEEHELTKTG